jgi:hypothetical protein
MKEITEPTEILSEAAKRPTGLYQTIRSMRSGPDTQLDTNRVFTCVAKFGETVLGDALAIFDEFTLPIVKQAKVGDIFSFAGFSLSVSAINPGNIEALVTDEAGTVRFQVDWNDETQYDKRGIVFREPPATTPGYHFQESILSAIVIKEADFGIHPIGTGFLDYASYFKAMEALSVVRDQLLVWRTSREPDPDERPFRLTLLSNYKALLELDGGVVGPACHWAVSQMVAQSTKDAMKAAAERFLLVAPEVEKLDVVWGDKFFNYLREDGYLAMVPTKIPDRKALFDIWTAWSFKHQGFLAVMDTDADGRPTEISFSLLSRGNGEFGKIREAADRGHFVGMPVARYSYVTGDVTLPRDFYEYHGLEVVTSFMRHGFNSIVEFNAGDHENGEVVSKFDNLQRLDNYKDEEFDLPSP